MVILSGGVGASSWGGRMCQNSEGWTGQNLLCCTCSCHLSGLENPVLFPPLFVTIDDRVIYLGWLWGI